MNSPILCHKDPSTSLAHLEPYLSLSQITSLTLLVHPPMPLSSSRLSTTSRLQLNSLEIHLVSPSGLTGYAHLLKLVQPRVLVIQPSTQHAARFTFPVERRSWDVFADPVGSFRARLRHVVLRGCSLMGVKYLPGQAPPTAGFLGFVPTAGGGGSVLSHAGGFFLAPPPPLEPAEAPHGEPADEADALETTTTSSDGALPPPPISFTLDLSAMPPMRTPFYLQLLPGLRLAGLFRVPGITEPGPELEPDVAAGGELDSACGGLLVMVRREAEREWVAQGLRGLPAWERGLVRMRVVEA